MGGGGRVALFSFESYNVAHIKAKKRHHSKSNFSNKDSLCSCACFANYTGNRASKP